MIRKPHTGTGKKTNAQRKADRKRREKAKAELAKVKDEERWLSENPTVIGASKTLVKLCKRRNRLEMEVADAEYENQKTTP